MTLQIKQIRNSIRNAQVDLSQLFRRNDIKFIQTKLLYENDKNEEQKFELFVSRLKAIQDEIIVMPFPKQRSNTW